MSYNPTNVYDVDPHVAEVYDQSETYHDDVDLIVSLLTPIPGENAQIYGLYPPSRPVLRGEKGGRGDERGSYIRILEPFCGTGRILISLAQAGHTLVGLDQAAGMLERARQKLARLPEAVQGRVTLRQADVIADEWPAGFDLVILGGNCLYELATPEEQERVIRSAAASLNPGGYVYVDNDHMEGDLVPSWQQPGARLGFPTGVCADGARVESTIETIWYDAPARLVKFRRNTHIELPSDSPTHGQVIEAEYIQQKHPVSFGEVQAWLERYGFSIEKTFGDFAWNPYTPASERAIFWARKYPGDGS